MGVIYKNYFKINLTFLYIILYFCIFLYIIWNGYEFEMFAHDFFSLGLINEKNNRKLLYFICLIYATYMRHKNDILKAVTGHGRRHGIKKILFGLKKSQTVIRKQTQNTHFAYSFLANF